MQVVHRRTQHCGTRQNIQLQLGVRYADNCTPAWPVFDDCHCDSYLDTLGGDHPTDELPIFSCACRQQVGIHDMDFIVFRFRAFKYDGSLTALYLLQGNCLHPV